ISGNSLRPSGHCTTPACTSADGRRPVTSSPFRVMLPAEGFSRPLMVLNKVVLPAPLAPSSTTSSPCPTVMDTLSRALKLSYLASTFSSFNILFTPQVSLDDHRIVLDLFRGSLGDLLAVVQHHDLVRQTHD